MDGDSTCWTLIRGAAEGDPQARAEFARRYLPVVRAYLGARWRHSPLRDEIDDATQEVFLTCFRREGALAHAEPGRGAGFLPFFYGVVRNVARQSERGFGRWSDGKGSRPPDLDMFEADEEGLSTAFDRAWAKSIMREATELQAARAREAGDDRARRRHELLRVRFEDGVPIREIARLWGVEAEELHREYARARREFQDALLETVSFHHPGTPDELERECVRLLEILA